MEYVEYVFGLLLTSLPLWILLGVLFVLFIIGLVYVVRKLFEGR